MRHSVEKNKFKFERLIKMTFEKIAKILAEYRDMNQNEITLESSFDTLGLDSLDMVDLVMLLEDEFHIEIEIDKKLETVADLVKLVDSLKK